MGETRRFYRGDLRGDDGERVTFGGSDVNIVA
jgi:hypothetical protein